jgi:hypothetical protein
MMEEHQNEGEQEIFQLSNLSVEAIGLVRRPAVGGGDGKKFYFIKSAESGEEDIGGNEMADQTEDRSAEPQEGQVQVVDEDAFNKLQAEVADLKAQLAAQPLEVTLEAEIVEEQSSEPETDLYAEAVKEVEERFAEQLKEEREAREEMAEKFAAERHKRRLAEFTDNVSTDFASLPIGEAERFAADMMAIHDADAERHGRLVGVLKAAQEAVKQGELFSQFSSAQPATGVDPFEAQVEVIRKERYSDKPANEGFAAAWLDAEKEHSDLARAYAMKH